jgi:2-dehydro-3-deoxygluconokinase
LKAVRAARDLKIPVSVDLNFRKKLWNYGKPATEIMPEIVRHCDVLIANEEDIQLALGIKTGGESGASTADAYYSLCRMTNTVFPNLRAIAVTLRENESADINKWSAILFNGNEQHHSTQYRIADVVDRVGVGDSFAAGLIYGMLNFSSNREILEFATAASCLKHSIPGDINLSTKEEIRSLAKGNSTGRISR